MPSLSPSLAEAPPARVLDWAHRVLAVNGRGNLTSVLEEPTLFDVPPLLIGFLCRPRPKGRRRRARTCPLEGPAHDRSSTNSDVTFLCRRTAYGALSAICSLRGVRDLGELQAVEVHPGCPALSAREQPKAKQARERHVRRESGATLSSAWEEGHLRPCLPHAPVISRESCSLCVHVRSVQQSLCRAAPFLCTTLPRADVSPPPSHTSLSHHVRRHRPAGPRARRG